MTEPQHRVLVFVADYIRENGHSPSYREIYAGIQAGSMQTVFRSVETLIERGYLRKFGSARRSLEVVGRVH